MRGAWQTQAAVSSLHKVLLKLPFPLKDTFPLLTQCFSAVNSRKAHPASVIDDEA